MQANDTIMSILTFYGVAIALLTFFVTVISLIFIRKSIDKSNENNANQEKNMRLESYTKIIDMMENAWNEDNSIELINSFKELDEPSTIKNYESLPIVDDKDKNKITQKRIILLIRSIDKLGLLVKHGVVPVNFVSDFYSSRIVSTWRMLWPVIEKLRKEKKHPGLYTKVEILTYIATTHRAKWHDEACIGKNMKDDQIIEYWKGNSEKYFGKNPRKWGEPGFEGENWGKTMWVEKGMGIYD
ncbi:MAG: DUF4760 domain-containing protein [Caldisericales bacterium]|nr:DUF4760 domain-containing protein [Caldisericales bacterium]